MAVTAALSKLAIASQKIDAQIYASVTFLQNPSDKFPYCVRTVENANWFPVNKRS